MSLYVIPVPAPAAGTDWLYTVPGQYIEHITAISATLTGSSTLTTMADSSGHARNGSYLHHVPYPKSVAGLVTGDAAIQTRDPATIGNAAGGSTPPLGIDWTADFTVECWITLPQIVDQTGYIFSLANSSPARAINLSLGNGGFLQFDKNQGAGDCLYQWDCSAIVTDGLPHYYALEMSSGTVNLYVDGNLQTPTLSSADVPITNLTAGANCFENVSPTAGINGTCDELAFYGYAIGQTKVSAHYAAGLAGIGTYAPAVLADLPAAYYHLNEGSGAPAQVDLVITDGTRTVLEIPTGFGHPTAASPWAYNWQPNLNSSSQAPTGSLTTVAIPNLILPAGYTIGTRTLDLPGGDSWSNINIWWDDRFMQIVTGLADYHYPPGAYYVYEQIGAS